MKRLLPTLSLLPGLLLSAVAQDEVVDTPLVATETEESFIPTYSFAGAYGLGLADSDFESGEGGFSYNEASVWGDAPLYLGEKLKWTLGVRYRYNGLDAGGDAGDLLGPDLDLHRIELATNLWYDASDRWKFWGRLAPGVLTDFSDISGDDFGANVLALGLYEFNDRWRGAIGGFFTSDLGDARLLPALGVIWTPSQQWSVSLTFPRLQIAHAPTRDWLLTINASPGGGGWNVESAEDSATDDQIQLLYSAFRVSGAVERRIGETKLWAFAEAGLQFAQNIEIQDDSERVLFEEDVDNAFFGAAGVKLRF